MSGNSELFKALGNVQGITATKTRIGQVGHQKYKYADINSVDEAIQDVMTENELVLSFLPGSFEGNVYTLNYVLVHTGSGESISGSMGIPVAQTTPQAIGSANTYARRYITVSIFRMLTDDDDGHEASYKPAPAQETSREGNRTTPAANSSSRASGAASGAFSLKDFKDYRGDMVPPFPSVGIVGAYLTESKTPVALTDEILGIYFASAENPSMGHLYTQAAHWFANNGEGDYLEKVRDWIVATKL